MTCSWSHVKSFVDNQLRVLQIASATLRFVNGADRTELGKIVEVILEEYLEVCDQAVCEECKDKLIRLKLV